MGEFASLKFCESSLWALWGRDHTCLVFLGPQHLFRNSFLGGFPGGPVVKNLTSNAGDSGLIPGWGTKILHTVRQLSPSATTAEPSCSRALMPQLEKPGQCKERFHTSQQRSCTLYQYLTKPNKCWEKKKEWLFGIRVFLKLCFPEIFWVGEAHCCKWSLTSSIEKWV